MCICWVNNSLTVWGVAIQGGNLVLEFLITAQMWETRGELIPNFSKCSSWPMPDNMSMCGEPMALADRLISFFSLAVWTSPFFTYSTPGALLP